MHSSFSTCSPFDRHGGTTHLKEKLPDAPQKFAPVQILGDERLQEPSGNRQIIQHTGCEILPWCHVSAPKHWVPCNCPVTNSILRAKSFSLRQKTTSSCASLTFAKYCICSGF